MSNNDDAPKGESPLNRREFLQLTGTLAAVAAIPLVGCGDDETAGQEMALNNQGEENSTTNNQDVNNSKNNNQDEENSDNNADDENSDENNSAAPEDGATLTELDPEDVAEDSALFPMGVQSGDVAPGGVAIVWTYATRPDALTLRVWRPAPEAEPGQVWLVREDVLTPNDAGFIKHKLEGLGADTAYTYAFFDGPSMSRSPIGRFLTAFAETQVATFTLAATACTNWRDAPYPALSLMARLAEEEAVHAFAHLGDMAYNDSAVTLEDYRRRWRDCHAIKGYQDILSSMSLYATWDDHEIDNNFDIDDIGQARFLAGKEAWIEAHPFDLPGVEAPIWRSFRWGHSAEIFVLDCRSERDDNTIGDSDATYIGEDQFEWLTGALADSPCHFKIVLNSVPITNLPTIWALREDRWSGYEAQRQALLDSIDRDRINNVWFLSGDFHVGFVSRIEPDISRRTWEIAVGPGGNTGNPLTVLLASGNVQREEVYPESQFRFGNGTNCATFLTFDPDRDMVRVRFIDADTEAVLYDEWLKQ